MGVTVDMETWIPAQFCENLPCSSMLFVMVVSEESGAELPRSASPLGAPARHIALIASRPPTFLQTVETATVRAGPARLSVVNGQPQTRSWPAPYRVHTQHCLHLPLTFSDT